MGPLYAAAAQLLPFAEHAKANQPCEGVEVTVQFCPRPTHWPNNIKPQATKNPSKGLKGLTLQW
jgi:hypothetical protein